MSYQKCVDRIVIENNKWKDKGGNDKQVSVYFKWSKPVTEFRYCPKFSEIKDMIEKLKELYGEEYVKRELEK